MSIEAQAFIARLAKTAEAFALQAGVGGMETAGGIVSYLAAHPEHIETFMRKGSTFDLPEGWFENGCLTWQAKNGKIVHPSFARQARLIKQMEEGRSV